MTEQLERDLSDLFSHATERLDIRPAAAPHRFTRLNVALAAAVTFALVGGVAVAGSRLASSSSDAGLPSSGADAKARLVAAFAKTFNRSIEMDTTFRANGQNSTTTQSEVDFNTRQSISRTNGQVSDLFVGGRSYRRVLDTEKTTMPIPARVQWVMEPRGFGPSLHGGFVPFMGIDPRALYGDPTMLSGFHVKYEGKGRYVVAGSSPSSGPPTSTSSGVFVVGKSGSLTGATVSVTEHLGQLVTGLPATQTFSVSVRIRPLSQSLHLAPPARGSVITEAQWQKYFDAQMRVQRQPGEHCVTSPPKSQSSAYSSVSVMCSSTATAVPVRVTPQPVPSHR